MSDWNAKAHDDLPEGLEWQSREPARLRQGSLRPGRRSYWPRWSRCWRPTVRRQQFPGRSGGRGPHDRPAHRRNARAPTIGPYKLLEQIGEGGMGVVYMAEQTEPVQRQVALKIIKPGMDTRQVIARFEAERQALAMMDHPEHRQGVRRRHDGLGPAVLRHGTGQRHPDHRLLRPASSSDDPRAAGAVRPRLPGGPARPPEGHHPPRPQAVERPGRRCTTSEPVPKIIDFGVAKAIGAAADRADARSPASVRWSARRCT